MPNRALVKSRWRYNDARRVATIFSLLGIPFRTAAGKTFWEANAVYLADLYRKFLEQSERRLLDLHPDRTGQPTDIEFAKLANTIARVKKIFARAGVRIETVAPPILEVARAKFKNPAQVLQVMNLIRKGYCNAEIVEMGAGCPDLVAKARKAMAPVKCECGRPGNHKGFCGARIDRKPNADEIRRRTDKLPQNQKGYKRGPHSAEHRRKIGEALRGKPKSLTAKLNAVGFTGKRHSLANREKARARMKGKKHSAISRERRSASLLAYWARKKNLEFH